MFSMKTLNPLFKKEVVLSVYTDKAQHKNIREVLIRFDNRYKKPSHLYGKLG